VSHTNRQATVRLRGHTLLCLQGFRGEGYSPGFIDNLAAIHRSLTEHPEQVIEVVDAPDTVCGACPHRIASGCSLKGEDSEEGMKEQDRHVLSLLGLKAGSLVRWSEVLDRIRASIRGDSLPNICGQCRWLPLGYCREGIEKLRSKEAVSSQLINLKLTADS
jgi:hypothetical protein